MRKVVLIALVAVLGAGLEAQYKVDSKNSVLAVITHKAGLASGLAHNHFVKADKFRANLQYDAETPTRMRFEATLKAKDLRVDVPRDHKKWFPTIKKLGILDEAFSEVSASDRKKIRAAMLGESQLDADQFPKISGRILSLKNLRYKVGQRSFSKGAKIELSVHGKTAVRSKAPANISMKDGKLVVEIVALFKFSEFGITPYSAFFGAVKNQDRFHLYLKIVASRSN